ncbi:hypothetical protein ACERK3_00345 [Phycisphaerales bacterium AB-hyl4]|uniref:Uncharacterized protein n=1 Tax=Natronomicrosphaera hydrolytica TaxID=3242702 RepID=A0ABV4U1M0_9BACT
MTRRYRQHLGLVVDEHAIRVADGAGGVAELALTGPGSGAGGGLSTAEAVGQALRGLLDETGLRGGGPGGAVLVGVAGRWLAVRSRAMPPASGEALAGAVRLAGEREFPGQAERLVIDYTPEATTTGSPEVLLCALPSDRLAWLEQVAAAAKLRLAGVTPSAAVLTDEGLVLHLAPGRCELAAMRGGRLHLLHHLGTSLNGVAPADGGAHDMEAATRTLTAEVRRTLATFEPAGGPMQIDDAIGLDAQVLDRIGRELALDVQRVATPASVPPRFAPAARLAACDPQALAINFVTARTRRAPKWQVTKPMRVGLLAAVLALLVVGWYVVDVVSLQRTINEHRQWQAQRQTELARATVLRDDLRTARGWLEDRPTHLEMLLGLTMAFPERGDVWATNVTLDDNGAGAVSGRGRNERDVLDLLGRLQATAGMGGAKLVYVREADARSREVSFQINLTPRGEGR